MKVGYSLMETKPAVLDNSRYWHSRNRRLVRLLKRYGYPISWSYEIIVLFQTARRIDRIGRCAVKKLPAKSKTDIVATRVVRQLVDKPRQIDRRSFMKDLDAAMKVDNERRIGAFRSFFGRGGTGAPKSSAQMQREIVIDGMFCRFANEYSSLPKVSPSYSRLAESDNELDPDGSPPLRLFVKFLQELFLVMHRRNSWRIGLPNAAKVIRMNFPLGTQEEQVKEHNS